MLFQQQVGRWATKLTDPGAGWLDYPNRLALTLTTLPCGSAV
ncbi:hypothetical protein ACNKHV_22440 [Shigella flexneri]